MSSLDCKKKKRKEYCPALGAAFLLVLLLCTVTGISVDDTAMQTTTAEIPAWKQTAEGTKAGEEAVLENEVKEVDMQAEGLQADNKPAKDMQEGERQGNDMQAEELQDLLKKSKN